MVKRDSEFMRFKNNKHGQVSLILEFLCLLSVFRFRYWNSAEMIIVLVFHLCDM